jgi:hypothetical protein
VGRNLGTRPMVYKALGIVWGGVAGKVVVKNEHGTWCTFLLPRVSPRSEWTSGESRHVRSRSCAAPALLWSIALISVPSRRRLSHRTSSSKPGSSERRRVRRTGTLATVQEHLVRGEAPRTARQHFLHVRSWDPPGVVPISERGRR